MHGKSSKLLVLDDRFIFKTLPKTFDVGHYHSWKILLKHDSVLIPTAINENEIIMAFRHKKLKLYGLQFHPESILTEYGKNILINWLKICS